MYFVLVYSVFMYFEFSSLSNAGRLFFYSPVRNTLSVKLVRYIPDDITRKVKLFAKSHDFDYSSIGVDSLLNFNIKADFQSLELSERTEILLFAREDDCGNWPLSVLSSTE